MSCNLKPLKVLLSRQANFCVALRLENPNWSREINQKTFGRACRSHGAEFQLRVVLAGPISKSDGMIVNLSEIKPKMNDLVALIEDKFLDQDINYFRDHRPTIENIAIFLWREWPEFINCGRLHRLEMNQSTGEGAEILVDFPTMKVSHSYEFAAAHRLFVPSLSPQENWDRFDKCSNHAGHGHNFQLRVWIEGVPDEETGYIINPRLLDAVVDEEIYNRFDHKHLNEDCPEFSNSGLVPTSENLALVIFGLLRDRLTKEGYQLARVGLQETQKNYFEVEAQIRT